MKTVLGVAILAVCLAGAFGLECYTCTDCSLPGVLSLLENKQKCPDVGFSFGLLEPRCIKTVGADGSVTRACSTSTECAAASFVQCSSGDSINCATCCDTDRCNSALNLRAAWLALGLALLVALLIPRM